MEQSLEQFIACRDQLAHWGQLLTSKHVNSSARKQVVRTFRDAALVMANAAVELARRNIALIEENRLLRSRMAVDQHEPDDVLL
jgi:hypothetical protein